MSVSGDRCSARQMLGHQLRVYFGLLVAYRVHGEDSIASGVTDHAADRARQQAQNDLSMAESRSVAADGAILRHERTRRDRYARDAGVLR